MSPQALVDALVQVTADPDVGVRHAATEVLAQQATSDAQVEALWRRLSPESEPEENVRVTAWRGATRVLAGRPVSEIDNWLAQLPGDEATRRRQSLELLQAAEKSRELQPEARGELGQIRARIAKLRAEQDQIEPALATYLMALEDLRASKSAEAAPVAIELLCFALRNDRYDAQVAGALNLGNSTLDVGAVWEAARKEVETCLRPEEAERAVTMLRALQSHPPASMPANIQETLQQLLQRAHAIQAQADAAAVNAALARLRAHPDDEQARQAIIELGARAVPALRDALRTTVSAASPDADAERRLHDLLKAVRPDWPGFAAEAPLEEKLKALEALNS